MWFVPVVHPAATFRQPAMLGPLKAHLVGYLQRSLVGLPTKPAVEVNPHAKRLAALLKIARDLRLPLSVDVESGQHGHLAPYAHLRAIGVGLAYKNGWGLSWEWAPPQTVLRLLGDAFADAHLSKLFVNGWAYDIPILNRYGFKFAGPIHDIRDGRHALDSSSRVGLAPQAAMYLRVPPWKREAVEDETDEKGHVSEHTPLVKLLPYNALDCVYAAQVRAKQAREIRDDGERTQRIYRQLLRLARVGGEMHCKGLYFFRDAQAKLDSELRSIFRQRKSELVKLLKQHGGSGNFRITETGGVNEHDLAALLFRQCAKKGIKSFGLEVPLSEKAWTDGGKPAVNKDALLILFSMSTTPPEVKQIIRACWHVDAPLKLLGTYVRSKRVEDAIGPDGFIHPKVNTCGTETYRWSCKNPNLMNLPKDKDEEDNLQGTLPNIRSLYGAPPGYVIVSADFSQLELEVMAEYTGDKLLRLALDSGDAHTARAREWFGIPAGDSVPAAIRRQAKVVGFASQYSAGIETVYAKVLEQIQDAEFSEVETCFLLFREKHPGIVAHWQTSLEFAQQHGYNESPIMHYRRYYPVGSKVGPTDTSNLAIQGGAAAIANSTLVGADGWKGSLYAKLKQEFPKAWVAMHTYDSFDVVTPEAEADKLLAVMQETMAGPWQIGSRMLRYKSTGKIGARLSDT